MRVKGLLQNPGTHWKVINGLLMVLFAGVPFLADTPGGVDTPSFAIKACVAAIVLLPAATIAWLYFQKSPFKVPGWDKSPFNSRDPLQGVFLGPWFGFAIFMGALLQVPRWGNDYLWTAAIAGCVFLGFFVARILAYRIFRGRIESSRA
jgi:hypothetical protein